MASFRKTDSGKWEVEVYLGRNPATGKKRRRSKRFKLKKDAKKWAAEIEVKKEKGLIINAKKYTLKDLFKEWLEDYVSDKSPTTYDGYEMIIHTHIIPFMGKLKLKDINARHIKSYFKEKEKNGKVNGSGGLSGTTLLQHYHVFSGAFKYARKWDIMNNNPLEKIDPPQKSDYKANPMSKSQVEQLLKTAMEIRAWTYRFIYAIFKTGARRGEMLGLKWSDIEFNKNKVSIRDTIVKTYDNTAHEKGPKSVKSVRPIIVSDDVINMLKTMRKEQIGTKTDIGDSYKDNNLVFCMPDGSKVIPKTAYNRYTKVFKKAGLSQFNLKSLRHTHATFLLQAGVHPKIVQERLGHSSIKVTLDIYSHVIPSLQEKAVKDFENYLSEDDFKKNSGEMPGI